MAKIMAGFENRTGKVEGYAKAVIAVGLFDLAGILFLAALLVQSMLH